MSGSEENKKRAALRVLNFDEPWSGVLVCYLASAIAQDPSLLADLLTEIRYRVDGETTSFAQDVCRFGNHRSDELVAALSKARLRKGDSRQEAALEIADAAEQQREVFFQNLREASKMAVSNGEVRS